MPDRVASFAAMDSPIGRMWLSGTDIGLLVIARADGPEALLAELERRRWGAVADPESLVVVVGELETYFAGSLRSFSVSLDLREVSAFDVAAYRAAMLIPYGETASYAEVAGMASSPRAARAVGGAMARCPFFPIVPCHRVIHADGSIRGWGPDPWVKRWLLDHERSRS